MAWVAMPVSAGGFRARHDEDDARDAQRVLQSLSVTAARMQGLFPRPVDEITVVLHRSVASLAADQPAAAAGVATTAPAARRYVAGWAGATELHMLAPAVLRSRASNVTGSREMLALSGAALYARRVILENNRDLRRVIAPRSGCSRELRWAWLLDGAARWFAGQTEHARPAIAGACTRAGGPRFPPGLRDAPLLGGTVVDLLAREEGEQAAASSPPGFDPQGPRAALSEAFGGRTAAASTEEAWRTAPGPAGRRGLISATSSDEQPHDQRADHQRDSSPASSLAGATGRLGRPLGSRSARPGAAPRVRSAPRRSGPECRGARRRGNRARRSRRCAAACSAPPPPAAGPG